LDMGNLGKSLEVKKPTAQNFISLLESTHLIHRLPPHGYGKEILRARRKVYLADAAIGPSVLLKGKAMLQDDAAVSRAVETAFFKHVFTRYYNMSVGFSYWHGRKHEEVDIVAEIQGRLVPFEVKYRHEHTGAGELKGIVAFCTEKKVPIGYVITREMSDFSILAVPNTPAATRFVKVPAPLACYWLGQSELSFTRGDSSEG